MENEKKFKTKTGFCHILNDKIVLSRDGVIGNISNITVGNNISRILIIYGAFSVGLLYIAYESFKKGQIAETILIGFLAIYLIYGIFNSYNNSATPIIDRNKIKSVKFIKAIVGLTRSRFEVYFEDENGKIKKRLILLPGSLINGQNETEKAIEIMKEERLLN